MRFRDGLPVGYRAIAFRWKCGVGKHSEVFLRLFKAKPLPPVPDRFIVHIHATFMQKVFYVPQ